MQRIQSACRTLLRPIAAVIRRALTPPKPPVVFDWHTIRSGPAAGCQVILPRDSAIAAAITSGDYESQVTAITAALVAPGDTCIDIGGHYGYYTLLLAKLNQGGKVETFEPVAAHADRISESASRSGLSVFIDGRPGRPPYRP